MRISDWSSDVCSSDLSGESRVMSTIRLNIRGSAKMSTVWWNIGPADDFSDSSGFAHAIHRSAGHAGASLIREAGHGRQQRQPFADRDLGTGSRADPADRKRVV